MDDSVTVLLFELANHYPFADESTHKPICEKNGACRIPEPPVPVGAPRSADLEQMTELVQWEAPHRPIGPDLAKTAQKNRDVQ